MQPSTGQEAASFQHLPAHLQTHIFGLASAPLLVCKASLAILSDGALVARWFIANKLSPFLAAALARQWEACWHMLDSQCYKPSKWQIVAAVDSAAAHGQLELVQALLDRGARRMLRKFDEEPNFQDIGHEATSVLDSRVENHKLYWHLGYPIESAAAGGHLEVVKLLLDQQPSLPYGAAHAAFCKAAGGSHIPVMEFLLDSVPRISRPGQDENPLSWAAKGGHVGAISFLIRLGADPKNSRRRPFSGNMYATYPLEAAAEGGSVEVLEFLFDIVERWDWWEWRNALVAAAQHGHTEAVRCLLSHAAHDEAWDSEDEGEEDEDEESEGWPDEDGYNSDVSGFTEIRAERRQERRERERKHADSRLQVQVQDALVAACSRGHIQVMKVLLEHGSCGFCYGKAMEAAAWAGNVKAMELLLQCGAGLQPGCYSGEPSVSSLVGCAISSSKPGALKWLLERGVPADVNALVLAISHEHIKPVKVLLQHGVKDEDYKALFKAAEARDGAMVRVLVESLPPSEQPAALLALEQQQQRYLHGYFPSVKKAIAYLAKQAGIAAPVASSPAAALSVKAATPAADAVAALHIVASSKATCARAAVPTKLVATQQGQQQQQQHVRNTHSWLQRNDPRQDSRWPKQVQRSDDELESLRAQRKCFCCTRAGHPWYRCYQFFPR